MQGAFHSSFPKSGFGNEIHVIPISVIRFCGCSQFVHSLFLPPCSRLFPGRKQETAQLGSSFQIFIKEGKPEQLSFSQAAASSLATEMSSGWVSGRWRRGGGGVRGCGFCPSDEVLCRLAQAWGTVRSPLLLQKRSTFLPAVLFSKAPPGWIP